MYTSRTATLAFIALLGAHPAFAQKAADARVSDARSATTPSNAALDDATIVAIFDAANTWDIETSQLALRKSRDKDVRSFAQMMVHDHRAVRKLGRDLAAKLKVTPTPPGKDFALYQDHVAIMKRLRGLRGKAFDRAYIEHEATYHQAVIDAVTNTLLPATQNAELKNLETTVAPNFVAHLQAAKNVQAKVEAKVASK
jgi:putative membrane protein